MFLDSYDHACCLTYAAFLGDTKTLAGLLFTGEWPQESLDKSLLCASGFNHMDTVLELLTDGRANPCALEGEAIKNAAIQNNHEIVKMICEKNPAAATYVKTNLLFIAHMDHINVIKTIAKYDPFSVFSDTTLISALRSNSTRTIQLILNQSCCWGNWRPGPEVLGVALEKEEARKYISILLRKGAKVDSALYKKCERHSDCFESILIKKQRIAQLWRKVKAIVLIDSFWRNWIMDYYSPGNDRIPQGKGFRKSQGRFLLNLENERKQNEMCYF